jgi:hypothetical protein
VTTEFCVFFPQKEMRAQYWRTYRPTAEKGFSGHFKNSYYLKEANKKVIIE